MSHDILKKILKKIKPSKEEEERVRNFATELIRIAKTISGYDAVICGSIGKYTWLKGDHDVDLFILFPDVGREELEKRGLEFGKKIVSDMKGKYIIKYAEHPYVHSKINGFKVDIVPCYRIKKGEKIKSAVDRSPLHVEYVLEKLDPDLRDDVRLLKQFCKGISVYGSDARQQGFSGYICELLIIRYGSFEEVLKSAINWKAGRFIDIENIGEDNFKNQCLVIIDPTDSRRNAAANINCENFVRFIDGAKKFLEKPNVEYFFPKKPGQLSKKEIKELRKRETHFSAIVMNRPDIIDDTLFPQMRRAVNRLENLLKDEEFKVMRCYAFANREMILFFELEIWKLPIIKKMIGPPIFSQKHSKEFLSKYKKTSIEDNRWIAEKNREYKTASHLLKDFMKKNVKELEEAGIPDNIAKKMNKAKLLESENFWKFVKKNTEFSIFLKKKYF